MKHLAVLLDLGIFATGDLGKVVFLILSLISTALTIPSSILRSICHSFLHTLFNLFNVSQHLDCHVTHYEEQLRVVQLRQIWSEW